MLKCIFVLDIRCQQHWIHVSNTNIHFQNWTFPNPVPEGHKETLQLTFSPKVLAWYIQYQHIYSTIYSPNCWHHISNANIHIQNCTFPYPVPEGHKETIQLTFVPKVLAWYIQYQHIFWSDTYSPSCWHRISNTDIHFQQFNIHISKVRRSILSSKEYNISLIKNFVQRISRSLRISLKEYIAQISLVQSNSEK